MSDEALGHGLRLTTNICTHIILETPELTKSPFEGHKLSVFTMRIMHNLKQLPQRNGKCAISMYASRMYFSRANVSHKT